MKGFDKVINNNNDKSFSSDKLLENNHKISLDGFINEVIRLANYLDLMEFTNLKLQKLLHYCYAISIKML